MALPISTTMAVMTSLRLERAHARERCGGRTGISNMDVRTTSRLGPFSPFCFSSSPLAAQRDEPVLPYLALYSRMREDLHHRPRESAHASTFLYNIAPHHRPGPDLNSSRTQRCRTHGMRVRTPDSSLEVLRCAIRLPESLESPLNYTNSDYGGDSSKRTCPKPHCVTTPSTPKIRAGEPRWIYIRACTACAEQLHCDCTRGSHNGRVY